MKRLIPAVAIFLAWATAWAAPPTPLTTLRAIVSLSNAEADRGLPVAFEATVTFYNKAVNTLFVQDDGVGIYVFPKTDAMLLLGDRVLVRGKTIGSFHPIVSSESIAVLRHGDLPKPVPATYGELIRAQRDCLLVTVRGIVRTVDTDETAAGRNGNATYMQVLVEGGYISVYEAEHYTEAKREEMLDAEVEITGVAGGVFDGKTQMHGITVSIPSTANIKILKRAGASPWSLPLTPMDMVIASSFVDDRTQRVRVHGTITYYQPGSSVVLQDGMKSIWISTLTRDPMQVGDVVDATGFPESHNGFLALVRGEILDSHAQAPLTPLATTRKELAENHHIIDLVSVEGQVVSAARGATQDEYHMTADGQIFTAVYRHPSANSAVLPPMKEIPIGAFVRATGICITEDSNPFSGEVSFDILMRTPDDIAVVIRPSPINTRNLIIIASILLIVVIAVSGWGWTLRRKVRIQTDDIAKRIEAEAVLERRAAQLERQRSRILEDINGARPLSEILEQIAAMVSFGLKSASCWCETADGATLGVCPSEEKGLRIVREKIVARSGPPLGTIFAGLDPLASADDSELETLSVGARLATLAIETRRLYTDLRRRSEFDLLTEIHNRFSMNKHLDALIEEAQQNAGIFGLIYIDLDKFKPINDRYGHHVGDLYLQEVAVRMKRQLRGGDMLARLGGDEFAALVTMVHSRADVEEVVLRMEQCFDAPFVVEGYLLRGAASFGIALYPEDSATKDSLLNAADAAMYAAKHGKRQIEKSLAHIPRPDLLSEERG
jgi:diguanylate cyclase (GGDEF)-like protein